MSKENRIWACGTEEKKPANPGARCSPAPGSACALPAHKPSSPKSWAPITQNYRKLSGGDHSGWAAPWLVRGCHLPTRRPPPGGQCMLQANGTAFHFNCWWEHGNSKIVWSFILATENPVSDRPGMGRSSKVKQYNVHQNPTVFSFMSILRNRSRSCHPGVSKEEKDTRG